MCKYLVKTTQNDWVEVPRELYETYPGVVAYYLMSKSEMTYIYALVKAQAGWTKKESRENGN